MRDFRKEWILFALYLSRKLDVCKGLDLLRKSILMLGWLCTFRQTIVSRNKKVTVILLVHLFWFGTTCPE